MRKNLPLGRKHQHYFVVAVPALIAQVVVFIRFITLYMFRLPFVIVIRKRECEICNVSAETIAYMMFVYNCY